MALPNILTKFLDDFRRHIPEIAAGTQAFGQVAGGISADRSARFTAAQLEQQAGQTRASSQRDAIEQRRQARLAQSRLQALAGGGGMDPTVVMLASSIAGEGEFRALSAMFEGEERARGMELSAASRRFEGRQAKLAGIMKAGGTILEKSPSLFEKYGKVKPGLIGPGEE